MTAPETTTPALGGVAEISELFNVPRTTVSMWDSRRATSGFPSPVQRLAMGPLYDMAEVSRWYSEKYPPDYREDDRKRRAAADELTAIGEEMGLL